MTTTETFAFQSDINQLLSLIINTFYSNKEVFLRELVSNASDALDKIRYASLTDKSVLGDEADLCIQIIPNKDANTLTIVDSGVGMTKDELIKNLGTIAHSGTRAFMEAMAAGSADVNLIGQFGVGFYSAFLVANTVEVISKSNEDPTAYMWSSHATGSFSVHPYEKDDVKRGTKIILHMKDDQKEYLEEHKVKDVIRRHSQFCSYPIRLLVTRQEQVPDESAAVTEEKEKEEGEVEVVEKEEDDVPKQPPMKTITKEEYEHLNQQQPIWSRKPEDVTRDEYASFYKTMSGDWEDHLAVKHFSVDGAVQFKALLYIPKRLPMDMFNSPISKKMNNIKLYVRKVLIMEESNELVPDYMTFVKGVVDSDDLPLNVSREMLQQNNIMRIIKKNITKKVIEMISELSEEDFKQFYDTFAKNLKLGVHDDHKNREKIIELLRFHSSRDEHDANRTSFKDYVSRMKEGQKDIYYIAGESLKSVKSSPFIQKLKKKGYEVLYMVEAIDEYLMQQITEYDGKKLVNCTRDGLVIDGKSQEDKEKLEKEWESVCNKIKNILGDRVVKVQLSERVETVPCVMVSEQYGWSANMERIMKAQALRSENGMYGYMGARKVLEINPDHKIMKEIKANIDADKDVKMFVELLFETVMIDSGFSIEEPSRYAGKIYKLIQTGLTGDEDGGDEGADVVEDSSNTEKKDEEPESVSIMEEVD
jgi:molecular chaperone HtpG